MFTLAPPMFEEDVRSEQFDTNTFKPRYPVFLSDPSQNGHKPQPAAPPGGMYPSVPTPLPTNPVLKPAQVSPMPSPAPTPAPSVPVPMPLPSSPPSHGPPPSSANTSKSAEAVDPGFEVLGFSIPPDYQPTPSAPPAGGGNLGWK